MKAKFTVFTPTFNRAHTLHRVYESLLSQTLKDFEWLVVDDGSTDETRKLIDSWAKEASFPVRYIFQENGGKPSTFNVAAREARGFFILPADSDDSFVPHALERFWLHWNAIPESERGSYVGIACLCQTISGEIIGDRFPTDIFDSDTLTSSYVRPIRGEKWSCLRTEVLKQFPFPTSPHFRFIPEGVVWGRIARTYRFRYVNEPLRIYYPTPGHLTDQLTSLKSILKNARGHLEGRILILNEHFDFFKYAPFQFVKAAIQLARMSLHASIPLKHSIARVESWVARSIVILSIPVATLLAWRDRRRNRC